MNEASKQLGIRRVELAASTPTISTETTDAENPFLAEERRDEHAAASLGRMRLLFEDLVRRNNAGAPIGISYVQFVEELFDLPFRQVAGRNWQNATDTAYVLQSADQITALGGRLAVVRNGTTLMAGMDTFIWPLDRPHLRSAEAWNGTLPYTRAEWTAVFPTPRVLLLRRHGSPKKRRNRKEAR